MTSSNGEGGRGGGGSGFDLNPSLEEGGGAPARVVPQFTRPDTMPLTPPPFRVPARAHPLAAPVDSCSWDPCPSSRARNPPASRPVSPLFLPVRAGPRLEDKE